MLGRAEGQGWPAAANTPPASSKWKDYSITRVRCMSTPEGDSSQVRWVISSSTTDPPCFGMTEFVILDSQLFMRFVYLGERQHMQVIGEAEVWVLPHRLQQQLSCVVPLNQHSGSGVQPLQSVTFTYALPCCMKFVPHRTKNLANWKTTINIPQYQQDVTFGV